MAGQLAALAGLRALRHLDLELVRVREVVRVTPKRPDATCLIAERRESPFASGAKRSGSSPPSPVFERAPIRFIAIASVSCASREIEPSDIAPVANRFTISLAGSTSSSGTPPSAAKRKPSSPRSVERRADVVVHSARYSS